MDVVLENFGMDTYVTASIIGEEIETHAVKSDPPQIGCQSSNAKD